jgi:hypothetical protein
MVISSIGSVFDERPRHIGKVCGGEQSFKQFVIARKWRQVEACEMQE